MSYGYVLRRVLYSVLVLLGASALVFFIARVKGDPVLLMAEPGATEAQLEAMRVQLGLHGPVWMQYLRWLGGALHGNLGVSIWQNQPAARLLADRLPFTLRLASLAWLVVICVGVPAGVVAARHRGTLWDQMIIAGTVAGQAVPIFWLGLMLIFVFAVYYRFFPTSGAATWRHLVLPVITLALFSVARTARMTRSAMLEVLNEDYVRTARAKGLAERAVLSRHALRNALLSVVTVLGLEFGVFLGGSVITETIFALPGVGQLAVRAIFNRDFPLIQAVVLMSAVIFVTVNFLLDLVYMIIDPRIRYA